MVEHFAFFLFLRTFFLMYLILKYLSLFWQEHRRSQLEGQLSCASLPSFPLSLQRLRVCLATQLQSFPFFLVRKPGSSTHKPRNPNWISKVSTTTWSSSVASRSSLWNSDFSSAMGVSDSALIASLNSVSNAGSTPATTKSVRQTKFTNAYLVQLVSMRIFPKVSVDVSWRTQRGVKVTTNFTLTNSISVRVKTGVSSLLTPM